MTTPILTPIVRQRGDPRPVPPTALSPTPSHAQKEIDGRKRRAWHDTARARATAALSPSPAPGVHLISLCPARQLWARLAPRDEDAETSRAAGGLSCGTFVTVVCARPAASESLARCRVPHAPVSGRAARGAHPQNLHIHAQQTADQDLTGECQEISNTRNSTSQASHV